MAEPNTLDKSKSGITNQINDKLGLIMLECSLLKNDLLKDECDNEHTAEDISNIEKAVNDVGQLIKSLP